MDAVQRLDSYQRTHGWLGAPLAVVYKFFEDRGPYLSALVTYYLFLSLFPLLLVFSSALGFFLDHDPSLQSKLVDSALRDFPIIGPQLRANVGSFHGSGPALAVGVIGTLYGGLAALQAAQVAFNRIYAVPRNEQPNPIRSRLRSLVLMFLLGGAVLLSTGVAIMVTTSNRVSDQLGTVVRGLGLVVSFAINVALFVAAFQLLTARPLRFRQLVAGGLLAAACWEVLQTLGTSVITSRLRHASAVYGTFGLVLATIAWIYVQALVIMLAAEVNVVMGERLWPRALLTPFTDNVRLTDADRRTYELHAATQRFKGFETVHAEFAASARDAGDERASRRR